MTLTTANIIASVMIRVWSIGEMMFMFLYYALQP